MSLENIYKINGFRKYVFIFSLLLAAVFIFGLKQHASALNCGDTIGSGYTVNVIGYGGFSQSSFTEPKGTTSVSTNFNIDDYYCPAPQPGTNPNAQLGMFIYPGANVSMFSGNINPAGWTNISYNTTTSTVSLPVTLSGINPNASACYSYSITFYPSEVPNGPYTTGAQSLSICVTISTVSGSFTVVCDPVGGSATATITNAQDSYGNTTGGYVTVGGTIYPAGDGSSSSGTYYTDTFWPISIPASTTSSESVTLWVYDTASGNFLNAATTTVGPCAGYTGPSGTMSIVCNPNGTATADITSASTQFGTIPGGVVQIGPDNPNSSPAFPGVTPLNSRSYPITYQVVGVPFTIPASYVNSAKTAILYVYDNVFEDFVEIPSTTTTIGPCGSKPVISPTITCTQLDFTVTSSATISTVKVTGPGGATIPATLLSPGVYSANVSPYENFSLNTFNIAVTDSNGNTGTASASTGPCATTPITCSLAGGGTASVTGNPISISPKAGYVIGSSAAGPTNPPFPMNITVTNSSGTTVYSDFGAGYTISSPYGSGTATVSSPLSLGIGAGSYTINISFVGSNCSTPLSVYDDPYYSVNGGDVESGSSFGSDACEDPSGNDGIIGYNTNTGPGYSGSGTNLAAEALDQITGFASAQGDANNSPPIGLSLSNTVHNSPLGSNNGGFYNYASCAPNVSTLGATTPAGANHLWDLSALASGNYVYDASYGGWNQVWITDSGSIAPGTHIVLTVYDLYNNADVFIDNNITYNTTGWNSPADVPSITVIANGGSIFINPDVTQLDGTYIARPGGPRNSPGDIYDCAYYMINPLDNLPMSSSSIPDTGGYTRGTCDSTLTVNGSFVANSIKFERAAGSIGTTTPGEQFNYTPEQWLNSIQTNPNQYDSITSLPPVL